MIGWIFWAAVLYACYLGCGERQLKRSLHAFQGLQPRQSPPRQRACPRCRLPAQPHQVLCSHCFAELTVNCVHCGELIDVDTPLCPSCHRKQPHAVPLARRLRPGWVGRLTPKRLG